MTDVSNDDAKSELSGGFMQETGLKKPAGDGEGNSGWIELQNVNNTSFPTCLTGMSNNYKNSTHNLNYFSGALVRGQNASAVNGLRFYMSSGNIAAGKIQVYGITD